jgi:hypothetical protein
MNTNTEPKVSFIVPCYKLGHLLSQCVNSILEQDFSDFEILIMNNDSPDNTAEVAESFHDPRVKHVRNETNLGHIRNYNKGLTLARGKYAWLLSADDMLRSPSVLQRYVDVLERNPGVGFVFCRAVELQGDKETGIAPWADCGDQDRIWNDKSFFTHLLKDNCIVACTVLVRKECYQKVGMFHLELPFASDWHMWAMLAMHYDVAYLAEPMLTSRVHGESLTSLYAKEYTRICVGDELSVLWILSNEAEHSGLSSLHTECEAAFVQRAVHLLMARLEGATPSMTGAEFEEILQTRLKDAAGIKHMRSAVCNALAEYVTALKYRHDPPISVADEIGVLWSFQHQAELTNEPTLRAACESVLINRAVHFLTAGYRHANPSMSETEFESILQNQIPDVNGIRDTRASVYTTLAEQQYCGGEYAIAARSYRLALTARPWRLKTRAKYMLLHTGTVGIRIRQLAG